MANSYTSVAMVPLDHREQTGRNGEGSDVVDQHNRASSDGPVAIFWDIENCPVPCDVRPEDIAGNIRMALRVHPIIKGSVMVFSAYGDFNTFPRRLREGCQRTGIKLIDVPNGRKDAADKAILVDMFLFALDNRPPSSIVLISGDIDFSPALHILGQRGYNIVLVIPSGVGVSSALRNAGRFVWDWSSVARGVGFLCPSKASKPPQGYCIDETPNNEDEEEAIVYKGLVPNHIQSPPVGCSNEDINNLKMQIVKLLQLSGGCLPLARLHAEYKQTYGWPLEYGAFKLVNIFKKMGGALAMAGKGQNKLVFLRNWKAKNPSPAPFRILSRDDKNHEMATGSASSGESSEEERIVVEEKNIGDMNQNLVEQFKQELQEILVSHSCAIFFSSFELIYQQRYKRALDYKKFGASNLEELLNKMSDVVDVHEEPSSKKKFMAAAGS